MNGGETLARRIARCVADVSVPVTGGRTINETVHLEDPANPMAGLTSQDQR